MTATTPERPRNGLPCPHCGSSDAAGYVEPDSPDSPMKCFSCGKAWGANSEEMAQQKQAFEKKDSNGLSMVEGVYKALVKRCITEQTCRHFDYTVANDHKGAPIQVATYCNPLNGIPVAQQWRYATKDFKMVGGKVDFFWGQHKCQAGGRRVWITEGQIDCMSVWQSLGGTQHAVSLPNGASSVKKVFAAQQDWLSQWECIILCFDHDEPGREAVAEAIKLCPPGKVKVVSLPLKDASDMLQAGRQEELNRALWDAPKWKPEAIVSARDVTSAFLTEQTMGDLWPWNNLNDLTFGRHAGCVYAVASAPGAGKTDLLTEVIKYDVEQGKRVGAIFLEEAPPEIKELVVSKLASKLLYYPDLKVGMEEKQQWEDKWGRLPGELLMVDMTKSEGTWESIEPLIRHLVMAEGCTTIIFDSFTVAWDNHADTSEEYRQRTYKAFTRLIKSYRDYGVHAIAASHLNKPPNTQQQHTAGAQIKQSHFYGSQAIPKLSTFCLGLERNQESEDTDVSNFARVRVVKARKFGRSGGQTAGLRYDPDTGRLNMAAPEEDPCGFGTEEEEM